MTSGFSHLSRDPCRALYCTIIHIVKRVWSCLQLSGSRHRVFYSSIPWNKFVWVWRNAFLSVCNRAPKQSVVWASNISLLSSSDRHPRRPMFHFTSVNVCHGIFATTTISKCVTTPKSVPEPNTRGFPPRQSSAASVSTRLSRDYRQNDIRRWLASLFSHLQCVAVTACFWGQNPDKDLDSEHEM